MKMGASGHHRPHGIYLWLVLLRFKYRVHPASWCLLPALRAAFYSVYILYLGTFKHLDFTSPRHMVVQGDLSPGTCAYIGNKEGVSLWLLYMHWRTVRYSLGVLVLCGHWRLFLLVSVYMFMHASFLLVDCQHSSAMQQGRQYASAVPRCGYHLLMPSTVI